MSTTKINDISVISKRGVSPVGTDTKLLLKHSLALRPKLAIDIGCGTGFIPIHLKKNKVECEGTDINSIALDCAKENARRNNVNVKFYYSNLFNDINKKYDLIIFNCPYGHTKPGFFSKIIELIKSIIPRENSLIAKISFELVKKQRKTLINNFLENVNDYLNDKGKILLQLNRSEMYLIKDFKSVILDKIPFTNSVIIVLDKKKNC